MFKWCLGAVTAKSVQGWQCSPIHRLGYKGPCNIQGYVTYMVHSHTHNSKKYPSVWDEANLSEICTTHIQALKTYYYENDDWTLNWDHL